MERPSWAPEGIDLDRPSAARVYDYFLGGAHNFAVDRGLAEMIAGMTPNIGDTMRANRSFLRRAVRFMLAEGIDQFLDLGSGIPTVGNVHEVVRQANPEGRVVYVDVDPIAVSHSRAILDDDEHTVAIQADVREWDRILEAPETLRLLDLTRPVGVLLLGVLHFVPDADDPAGIVARIRDVIAPGSYVALVNATDADQPPEVIEAQKLSSRTGTPIFLRSREALAAQHAGLTPVEPGLVHLPLWRPDSPVDVDDHPERFGALGVVARKDS
ncbi:SAM-dependent methyltransferase [Pseudonocardia sp. C8]|uniref:SAM-dependent methyltransferase n=1 Tax=Pseudonocardia sp. C8 TaxID=2762759 RepID=UPI00164289CA|nr:SAM-dependent methyltransferase [Pseudonocardia sp. C8]